MTIPPDKPNLPLGPGSQDDPPREIDSRELMQGHREIRIRHGEEAYRLTLTRSGKLILRK